MISEKDQNFLKSLRGQLDHLISDRNAVSFLCDLWLCSQLFDDIYDEGGIDKENTLILMNMAFVTIPQNPFYLSFRDKLQPLMHSMILQWESANEIEKNKGNIHQSYVLRAFFIQVCHYCAALLHGFEYAQEHAETFQKLHGEKFEDYKDGL